MEERILGFSEHHICLYCGKEIKGHYEDCDLYYECECSNAKKKRKIEQQIQDLKYSIPEHKYSIEQKSVLRKLDKDEEEY